MSSTPLKKPNPEPARAKTGRPRLGKETGRDTILSNALQSFARRGFDGVNIRDLAKQAGVNIALANYHFGSKQSLWEACLQQLQMTATDCVSKMQSLATGALPYPEKLVGVYATFIRFSADTPDYGLFILQEMLQPGERQELVRDTLIQPFQNVTMPLLMEGKALGLIRSEDIPLTFFMHSIAISHLLAGQGLVASFFTPEIRREETLQELLKMMIRSAVGVLPDEFEKAIQATAKSAR